jgi:hypothetical protein
MKAACNGANVRNDTSGAVECSLEAAQQLAQRERKHDLLRSYPSDFQLEVCFTIPRSNLPSRSDPVMIRRWASV